jgi:hypothetical protein
MTKDELKVMIRNGTRKNDVFPLADLSKLKSIANVTLEIDRETNDYYYKVSINDLVNKEFDYNILTDNGWELSLDEQYIYLFL